MAKQRAILPPEALVSQVNVRPGERLSFGRIKNFTGQFVSTSSAVVSKSDCD